MVTTKDLLRLESVVKILGDKVIIYDATFQIREGEIFGLIGPSGSGKTTILRTLIGFFKPEKGDVLVRSSYLPSRSHELYTSVSKHTDDVKSIFGFASQHPSVYNELTVEENLHYFGSLHGLPKQKLLSTTETLLNLLELTKARRTRASDLSGGMQRRLDIACAMINRPRVLILDEPTADLDLFLRKHIWDIIKRINQKGTTIIVSSHELSDIETLADRVAIINHGKVLAVDTPNNIKKRFISVERIRLRTYPGKYKNIQKLISDSVINTHIEGRDLLITTSDAEKTLPLVIKALEQTNESLTFIKVTTSSLNQVFLKLAKEDR